MTDLVSDRQKLSAPVKHGDRSHREVAERLSKRLKRIGGYGLSANQIGVFDSRTCLVSVSEDILFINPRVSDRRGTTQTTEGCLSFPGEQVRTERNVWVEVEADAWFRESVGDWNEIGGALSFGPDEYTAGNHQRDPDYIESIAVQHEIDHLNGKTIFDREVDQQPFEKSDLDKLGRNDKVRVENSEGERFDVKWKYAKKKVERRNDGGPWTLLEVKDT